MTTEQQKKFLELAKYSEQLKEKQEEVRAELTALMTQVGYDASLQDPETLVVYKIVKPNGTFMYYRDIDYIRTALPGKRAGTLSKEKAKELGYILTK